MEIDDEFFNILENSETPINNKINIDTKNNIKDDTNFIMDKNQNLETEEQTFLPKIDIFMNITLITDISVNISKIKPEEIANLHDSKYKVEDCFIQGQFMEHSIISKSDFPVCELNLIIPDTNKMFNSDSSANSSLKCLNNKLKWNAEFYKKIRGCFNVKTNKIKHIFYLKEQKSDSEEDDFLELQYYSLNLAYLINGEFHNLFSIKLREIKDSNCFNFFLTSVISLFDDLNKDVYKKHEELINMINEKNDLEDELENERKTFEDKKDDYIIKFMNLYDEKVKKLEQ